jgi:hypothetical protein
MASRLPPRRSASVAEARAILALLRLLLFVVCHVPRCPALVNTGERCVHARGAITHVGTCKIRVPTSAMSRHISHLTTNNVRTT